MSAAGILEQPTLAQPRTTGPSVQPTREDAGVCAPTELSLCPAPPPKPLPAILVALQQIPSGAAQYVRSARRVPELVEALRRRGIDVTESALPDGSWRMIVISPAR